MMNARRSPVVSPERRSLPRLQCKKCGVVYSGALPKDQRCMDCGGPLVEAETPRSPQLQVHVPDPANDTAPPLARSVGSPLLWAPGSSKRSELIVTRYLIKDPQADILGSGAKGVVYRAKDRRMGDRPVAIKLFFDDPVPGTEGERDRARTEREIRIQSLLTHPAIVTAHDRFESPHGSGIVLEYIDGESLEQRVKTHGTMAVRDAVRATVEVAKAAEFMHGQGIIHRDLKPANVLLTKAGNVKVIDFGIAKYKEEETGRKTATARTDMRELIESDDGALTLEGAIVGTPSYMSPEQALGRAAYVDERSDVYGVGAILYYALTGEPPFGGDDVEKILENVRKNPPASPRTRNPKVDPALDAIIMKALKKGPEERFPSASALVAELQRYLEAEPLDPLVYREPLSKRAIRALEHHRKAAAAVIAIVLAAILVFATFFLASYFSSIRTIEERLELAGTKLRELDVTTAIAIYDEVLKLEPGNARAQQGLEAAYKAQIHVDLLREGRRLLQEAMKTAKASPDDAEPIFEKAYFRLHDAKVSGSPAPELDDLLKQARGVARLDVAVPLGVQEAMLRIVALNPDDLSLGTLGTTPLALPVKALELPTGYYQATIEGKGLPEPIHFPVRIMRGADRSIEPIPPPTPGMVFVMSHPRFRPGNRRHDDLDAVPVEAFYIDRCEVTVGEYRQFLETIKEPIARKRRTPPHWTEDAPIEAANLPVTNVTLDDALAYAQFRGKDLPTEAQWQLAASGGLDDRDYPYGRRFVAGNSRIGGSRPDAVGTHLRDRSPFGALDMGGNVSELVKGTFDTEGTRRLAKGGSFWNNLPLWARIPVTGPDRTIGFRCAKPMR
ncbi:SUMF1/EgtB/PvdO family nonheme iron enzyme [bacterium]|nr:SUMF1/EgtB/PvdO family nonheme iron enzyme [bacterium]